MITGIVLGSLALLSALALYPRVWIRAVWGPDRRAIEVRYVRLRFRWPRRRRRVKKKRKRASKQGRRGQRSTLRGLKLAPELLRVGGKGLKFLFRHSELRHLRVEGSIGTGDPATTGLLWGIIQAAYGAWEPVGANLELAIVPDFDEGKTSLTIDAEGTVRLGALLATAAVILWYLPKRKLWRLLRERRRRRKKKEVEAT